MSPNSFGAFRLSRRFPRVSGDEPEDKQLIIETLRFSPRERG